MKPNEQKLSLTFGELRQANLDRQKEIWQSEHSWEPRDWALAVFGELGEASNLLKKIKRGERIPIEEVAKEIADAVTYLDLLANSLGIDLGDAVIRKFNEISQRTNSKVRL